MNSRAVFGCRRTLTNKSLLIQNKCSVHQNQVIREVEGLNIPQRIERGPTDILKALSNTVSSKHLSLTYTNESAMLLNESDSYAHRVMAVSLESGKKAAQWIVARDPQYFQYKLAEPRIEAYEPLPKLDEESAISEETLIKAIESVQVEHSIEVYKLLKKKNISVSQSTKQKLLELTCFYNNCNKPNKTMLVSKFVEETTKKRKWEENGFQAQLFYEMARDAKSYSAMILGSAKCQAYAYSYNMFREAEEHGIKFGIEVYNVLMLEMCRANGFMEKPEEAMRGFFEQMERWKLKPDLGTLEQALAIIITAKEHRELRLFAVKVLNEFKRLGVQPSLRAYSLLWNIFAPKVVTVYLPKASRKIVFEILQCVEDEMPPFRSLQDYNFFPRMMYTAFASGDFEMAKKVDRALNKGDNVNFLNRNIVQVLYYSNFLKAIFKLGTGADVLKYFSKVVSDWSIQSKSYKMIFELLKERKDGGALLQIVCEFNMGRFRESFGLGNAEIMLEILDEQGHQMTNKFDLEVTKELWYTFQTIAQKSRNSTYRSKILKIFCRHNEKQLADEVFDKTVQLTDVRLHFYSLEPYLNMCLESGDKARAVKSAAHLCQFGDRNTVKAISFIKSNFRLDADEWNTVNQLHESFETKNSWAASDRFEEKN